MAAFGNEQDMLLDLCRQASTPQEQQLAWTKLAEFVQSTSRNDGLSSESIARRVLLEWPYSSPTYLPFMDQVFDACDAAVVVSTCTSILKQLSPNTLTKLPLPSVLHACWSTLQRILLSDGSPFRDPRDKAEMKLLAQEVVLVPQIVFNACHRVQIRSPTAAAPKNFLPRLVKSSWTRTWQSQESDAETDRGKNTFTEELMHVMLARGTTEFYVEGLLSYYQACMPGALPQELASFNWSPHEIANLLTCMLQFVVAKQRENSEATGGAETELGEVILSIGTKLMITTSMQHQTSFVQNILFSRFNDVHLCPLVVQLLDGSGGLYDHLGEVASTWSQWRFCQEAESSHHHYVTELILQGLKRLQVPSRNDDISEFATDEIILTLAEGVSHRLESSLPPIRRDGMRVAQQLASRMGQDLHFDELGAQKEETKDEVPASSQPTTTSIERDLPKSKRKTKPKSRKLQTDPDADYDSSEEDSEQDSDDGTASDDSTVYDDELVPLDLNDPEEDLVETHRPLHLLEALELLRTEENNEHAYSRHETALESLPALIRKHPDDLADVAVSLALQLLRMEDKFGIKSFLEMRASSLLSLTVEEPALVGPRLIEEIFEEGDLSNRFACLGSLQEAAYELSGAKHLDERRVAKDGERPTVTPKLPAESKQSSDDQVARIQSKTRQKRSRRASPVLVTNRFTTVAPMWFYSLLATFVKNKGNDTLWTGFTGSQLLAGVFRTLAAIVEFSGVQCGPVLAKDLVELVWSFRDADVAEVRLSVLISVATAVAMLPEDGLWVVALDEGDGSVPKKLVEMSQADPDDKCRRLALSTSRLIVDTLGLV